MHVASEVKDAGVTARDTEQLRAHTVDPLSVIWRSAVGIGIGGAFFALVLGAMGWFQHWMFPLDDRAPYALTYNLSANTKAHRELGSVGKWIERAFARLNPGYTDTNGLFPGHIKLLLLASAFCFCYFAFYFYTRSVRTMPSDGAPFCRNIFSAGDCQCALLHHDRPGLLPGLSSYPNLVVRDSAGCRDTRRLGHEPLF